MKKLGQQTVKFNNLPQIISSASIVGKKEFEGPLGEYFDDTITDAYHKQNSWELAQIKMTEDLLIKVLAKIDLAQADIDYLLAGDLLNQIIASNFAARDFPASFIGLYGACSTMVEALALSSLIIDGGAADNALAFSSSHYQATERQFRTPNEYGDKYPPYKQRTVTGGGAVIISNQKGGVQVTEATFGKVVDLGVKDPQDMGAVMAPAASDTILQHLADTGRDPDYYDLIITGDLGEVGKKVTIDLLAEQGCQVENNYDDCGVLIYNSQQKVGAGGSGCGCSAVVAASYLLPQIMHNNYSKVLLLGTGALLNPTINLQGETIPGIAHAVALENTGGLTQGIGRKDMRRDLTTSIENLSGVEEE